MEKRTLYLVVAVVLVAGLVLSFSGLTAQTIIEGEPKNCIEDDNGNDPLIKGSTKYLNRPTIYTDYCKAGSRGGEDKILVEYYCGPGNIAIETEKYNCNMEFGLSCINGACA